MKVFFYETSAGNSPTKKFMDDLTSADQARFLGVIDELELYGLKASRLVFKPLEGKLWEIKFGTQSAATEFYMSCLKKI